MHCRGQHSVLFHTNQCHAMSSALAAGLEYSQTSLGLLQFSWRCQQPDQVLICVSIPGFILLRSHNNGPELRPFCGWYISSFSHARRLIEPSSSLPTNDASIAFWDEGSRTCKSNWALQG